MSKLGMILVLAFGIFFISAAPALAVCEHENRGIFKGAYSGEYDKTPCAITTLDQAFIVAGNVLSLLLQLVAGLFVLFMVKGGIRYMTAQGNTEQVEEAKGTISNAILGIIIVLIAFGIVRLIVAALGGQIL